MPPTESMAMWPRDQARILQVWRQARTDRRWVDPRIENRMPSGKWVIDLFSGVVVWVLFLSGGGNDMPHVHPQSLRSEPFSKTKE